MKKRTLALIMLVIFCMVTAAMSESTEEITPDPAETEIMEDQSVQIPLAGGWFPAEDPTITDELKALVDKATGNLVGASYTPVALLSTQVVAGMNYCILCKITPIVPDAIPTWNLVYIYADLEGNAEITNVWEIYVDKHA